ALAKDAGGKYPVTKLTGADFHVGSGRTAVGSFNWSPDGKQIAFTRLRSSRPDDWPTADVWLVTVATGTLRPLPATEAAEANPVFSPDGRYLACSVSNVPATWSRQIRVQVISLQSEGTAPKLLAPTFDEEPALLGWSEDGSNIYYTEKHRTCA